MKSFVSSTPIWRVLSPKYVSLSAFTVGAGQVTISASSSRGAHPPQ